MLKGFKNNPITILMTGTFVSQLIPFLVSPILTRIYTPEEFGEFGLFFSLVMVCSVFVSGRYEMSIVLPKSDKDAENILGLSIVLCLISSCILFLAIVLFKNQILGLFHASRFYFGLFVVPIAVFFTGVYQALNYWNYRKETYNTVSISRASRSLNSSLCSIILGLTVLKKSGLIIGDILGQLVSTLLLLYRTLKHSPHVFKSIKFADIKIQALRYKQFPMYNLTSGLLEKTSSHSPTMLLSNFFGDTVTGFFSFSMRIISAPSAIVAKAIGDIFRQEAIKEYDRNNNCKNLFIKTFFKLTSLSGVPFILFYLFAPEIFEIVFGQQWKIAGQYAKILTPMFFLQFVVSPLSNMFLIAEKQKIDFIIQVALLGMVMGSFYLGYSLFKNPDFCILLYAVTYCIKYIFELLLSYQFSLGKK